MAIICLFFLPLFRLKTLKENLKNKTPPKISLFLRVVGLKTDPIQEGPLSTSGSPLSLTVNH